ncbi:MAG: NUDIX hydrolase [Porticoccaceae bacterium]|nr:NUDIX hydrolase [Porticoccaceae bacterium]
MKYCSHCAEELVFNIPPGDNRERHVCPACNAVHYHNPRIITGCIPIHENRILLCKRAIEPRSGYWTLPAGFLENGETIAEGAARETREEACASVTLKELYGVFDVPHIGQVHMFYRATLNDLNFQPGAESLETRLFREAEIPWDRLAFPVIRIILEHYFENSKTGQFTMKTARVDRSPPRSRSL